MAEKSPQQTSGVSEVVGNQQKNQEHLPVFRENHLTHSPVRNFESILLDQVGTYTSTPFSDVTFQ